MRVEWQHGLIGQVAHRGIHGTNWGAEAADRGSLFTLTERARGCEIEEVATEESADTARRKVIATMDEGKWSLDIETRVQETRIVITQRLECLEPSVFQDFVMRFRFSSSSFARAVIGPETVQHEDSDTWHQHPVSSMELVGDNGSAKLRVVASSTADKLHQEMNVINAGDDWIVQACLLPTEPCDYYRVTWRNRFFTAWLGDTISRWLLSIPALKHWLWQSRGRGGHRGLQAQGLASLAVDETLEMRVLVDFD